MTPNRSAAPALPETFPLATIPVDEAMARQFRLIEYTAAHFTGEELFNADAGVVPGLGRPRTTAKAEAVLADFFGAEDAAFVQGAGTGAIRAALNAAVTAGDPLLIHKAPVYRTTEVTLRGIGVRTEEVDFNDLGALREALASGRFRWAYVQHTRQRLGDSYDPGEVLAVCRAAGVRTVVDDNYAVLRVPASGSNSARTPPASRCSSCTGPKAWASSSGRATSSHGSGRTTTRAAVRSRVIRRWTCCAP